MRSLRKTALLLILLFLTGCGIMVPNPATTPSPSPSYSVQSQTSTGKEFTDPAAPIDAAVGESFVIVLDSNATTGYKWQMARYLNENIVKFVTSEYRVAENPMPGAGGKEYWTFTATGPGQAAISLDYLRPWETDTPPAQTVIFHVTVR